MTIEFDLIARIRLRARNRADVLLGIGDDAALLRVLPDHDLVVSTDTLNVGVHFPHDTARLPRVEPPTCACALRI